eukprot:GHVH01001529.1.p1 GENE.GHVH01001529.1~~GHVH01001529.1.p1  ORF type:complete len:278 (+),score=29.62 GHVH01001529.1:184-1017(+)
MELFSTPNFDPLGVTGFQFDNVSRNKHIETASQGKLNTSNLNALKTGTTICGVVCKDCIVVGADTRATQGPIVADKNCMKLHRLADKMYCAGAGTAADLEHVTNKMATTLELQRLQIGKDPRTATVVSRITQDLFRYQGHVGAALVLGGYDITGPSLYMINPHGNSDRLPFAAMGSGSLHAMTILEQGYTNDLSMEQGMKLVAAAIRAGVFNDLGSGSNVDLVVIQKEGSVMHRNYEKPNPRLFRAQKPVEFQRGTTTILKEKVDVVVSSEIVERIA